MDKQVKPRFLEETTRTLNVREMVGKYLKGDVMKSWTEDFADKYTGEIVSVERNELLFKGGQFVTEDLACKIDFSIKAGEITEPIEVSECLRKSKIWKSSRLAPMLVKINTGLKSVWVMLWSDALEHALEIVEDYCEQIVNDDFTISEVKYLGATLVNRKEFYDAQNEQMEKLDITLNPLRYYTMDVKWKEAGTPYPFVNPSKEAQDFLRSNTFVCMADGLDEAKEIIGEEVSKLAWENDRWKSIEVHWEKGKPFSAGIIIPMDFCELYAENYNELKDNI